MSASFNEVRCKVSRGRYHRIPAVEEAALELKLMLNCPIALCLRATVFRNLINEEIHPYHLRVWKQRNLTKYFSNAWRFFSCRSVYMFWTECSLSTYSLFIKGKSQTMFFMNGVTIPKMHTLRYVQFINFCNNLCAQTLCDKTVIEPGKGVSPMVSTATSTPLTRNSAPTIRY